MSNTWRAVDKGRLMINAATATAATKTSKKKAGGTKKNNNKGGAAVVKPKQAMSGIGIGILKPKPVSPTLRGFLGGATVASRPHAVKRVWEYIRLHNLQNPNNKREIICDQKLKTLFSGKDTVGFVEVARLLSQHFVKSG